MAINVVSIHYNGGLLPDIILLTQCYLHRGTCLNTMKKLYYVFVAFDPTQMFFVPRRSRRVLICTTYYIISLFLWYCTVLYYILLNYY